ncbi:hypothetical protein [uncultured Aliiroseovarius sp.]|uniref:hypothetical protein n=1 Tax=uncultured Aliiroseovarius sp. TaxID=1658783 RepID=UPI00263A0168|nr:hypothetical protein [uncultured Aliiroseovarius sp.]
MTSDHGLHYNSTNNISWRVEKQALHRVYAKQASKLKSGRAAGKRRHTLQRDFFRNPKVKQAAILMATKGKIGRELTYTLARQVNPYTAKEYVVATYPMHKGGGGTRTICIPPPVLSATLKIIKSALDVEFVRYPSLYGVKDYGRDKAAEHIQRLQREGYEYLWQTDIKDCFDSFNLDALYGLPLPNRVISNILDTRSTRFSFQAFPSKHEAKKGASPETPSAATPVDCMVQGHSDIGSVTVDIVCNTKGPLGLMQGSPASSAVLAWHLNELLKTLPPVDDVQVIVCFDNLLIASRTEDGSRAIRNSLTDSLGRCSFGPLTLHEPTSADADGGIEFLGYNHPSGGSTIGIGHNARERLMRHLKSLEDEFEKDKFANPEMETFEMWNSLLDFASGYSKATDIEAEMAEFVEASSWIPAISGDPVLMHMHWRLFAPRTTSEETFFEAVRDTKRRRKMKS